MPRHGDHPLISAHDIGPGRVRVIGLAPNPAAGRVEIGRLRLRVAPTAAMGARQTIVLTGEIIRSGSGVEAIAPVVATFRVGYGPYRLYLPAFLRSGP
ncbi:MAG: hypothetical protein HY331_13955 [Chloroflexi bacterium]|nr:hypothetical protein [Chloroflexota bacterium]